MFLRLLTTEHRARAGPWDLIALVAAFALALVGVAWVSCAGELVGVAFTLLGVAWDRQARWPALVALVGVALVGVAFTLLGVEVALVGVDRSALALGELLGPRSVRWSWPPRSEREPGAEKEGSKRKEGRKQDRGNLQRTRSPGSGLYSLTL